MFIDWKIIEEQNPKCHEDIQLFYVLQSSTLIRDSVVEKMWSKTTISKYRNILKANLKL